MKLKHLLFSTLLCCNVAFAQTWNDETVKNLGDQARQSIEQLIQEDSNSEIPKILGTDIAQELLMLVKKERYSIERINEIIIYILKSNEKATPYIVLRNQLSPSKMHTLVMYENLLRYRDDDDLYPYAFQKINELDLKNNNELQEQRQYIQREFGFIFYDTSIDTRQDQPEVCARFSQNIRPEPAQDWKKLMTVNPTPKSDLRYKNNRVCFNTQWGTQYNITFDKKLQSDKKISLGEDVTTTVDIGHKEPMVRFEQDGNVLAQNEQRQLALTTANVSDVKVKLWQVPANNLSNSTIQSLIRSPNNLSEWSMNQLLDEEASLIFSGEFTVKKHQQDENITTNIPFDELMKGQQKKAGFYILSAKDSANTEEDEWSYNSSISSYMVFSISKAGLSAYYTPQGLWVELRNLENTTPIAHQDVTLYARNNEILSTVKTNEQGLAFFEKASLNGKHGATPSHVITLSEDFFSYINIHQSSYDLSDKGLSGRIENAPLQSWLWTDRGVYRPNDTLHLMWLLKKEQNKLFHDVPIWLEFSRPDGKVMLDKLIKADENGSYRFDYYFDNTAPQGQWSVRLYLGKNGHLLAQKTIPVTSLIPRQTEASILPLQASLSKGQQTSVTIQADWLYGAVAEELPAYLTTSIHDTRGLGNSWKGWQIGMHDEDIYYDTLTSEVTPTNTKGQAVFNVTVKAPPLNTKPLLIKFNAHVTEPSGQITSAKYTKPLLRKNPYVAIKNIDDKHVQVALVNDDGIMQSGNATWSLYRINYDGYWYKQGSQWNYQHNETPELVTSGDITLNNTTPTALTLPIPADSYDDWVLKVHGDQAETAGSVRLNFGYSVASNKGMPPDAIRISSNQQRYADKEDVKIHLKAPFSGKASVKFVHKDTIIKNHIITFVRGEADLSFPWNKEWDDGLWLLANAWNNNQQSDRNRRAIGLHWIGGDLTPYDLKLQAKLPETIRPNTELTIPLSVDTSQLKGKTWVRVAIVDDGLYQLGQSSFSNPLDTFFGKKQLNLSFFDIWGNIIKQLNAPQAILRSGADGLMSLEARSDRVALPLLDLQLVAQWTEPVMFDAQGQASVTTNVPEYNGRLRVMAVAWNEEKLGATEQTVQVKAPLVATLYAPPYLSVDDSSSIRVRLHNTTDKVMEVTPFITSQFISLNPVALPEKPLDITPDETVWVKRTFSVDKKNAQKRAAVHVTFKEQEALQLSREMDIRPQYMPQQHDALFTLAPQESISLKALSDGQLFKRKFFVSSHLPFDPQNILETLSNYPYGCNEQITSKAWNNLLIKSLSSKYGIENRYWGSVAEQNNRLHQAHIRLANRQMFDGGFTLWGGGYTSELWLSAYITEFLVDSRLAEQLDQDHALKRALSFLRTRVNYQSNQDAGTAYALYVLAKAGQPTQGATLRFAEERMNSNQMVISTASLHTISALVQQGDTALASRMLTTLAAQDYHADHYNNTSDYGSTIRNLSQSINVLLELKAQLEKTQAAPVLLSTTQTLIDKLLPELVVSLQNNPFYNTQELHWLATLADKLPHSTEAVNLQIDNEKQSFSGTKLFSLTGEKDVELINEGTSPVYITQNDWIIPSTQADVNTGYTLNIQYQDDKNLPVDLSQLKQNEAFTVLIETIVDKNTTDSPEVIFEYPLPAGVIIEPFDMNKLGDDIATPSFTENRDDRHIAAFNLNEIRINQKTHAFKYAIRLRAVQPGVWHAAGASITNMYLPRYHAIKNIPTMHIQGE